MQPPFLFIKVLPVLRHALLLLQDELPLALLGKPLLLVDLELALAGKPFLLLLRALLINLDLLLLRTLLLLSI